MDGLSVSDPSALLLETLHCIQAFLTESSSDPAAATAEQFQTLSAHIERAKAFRTNESRPGSSQLDPLWLHYRESLEALRSRLQDIEAALQQQRDHCLETHGRISLVREWHSGFTKTQ
jgi:hypothetical protein